MPGTVLGGERTARHHIMDVWVKLELATPGMEDTEEPGLVGADEAGIARQGVDGLRGGFKER